MSTGFLFALIVVQILVFQFLSVRLSRALPDYLVGSERLPASASDAIGVFRRKAARLRYGAGIVLLVSAILAVLALGAGERTARLALAAISILSSVALVAGYAWDRRTVQSIAGGLPASPVRSAILEERTIDTYVPVALEAIPFLILVAVISATAWMTPSLGGEGASAPGTLRLYAVPIVLAVVALAGFAISRRLARCGSRIPQKARAYQESDASAALLGEALTALEMRFFLAAKIGITLMLGLKQVENLLRWSGQAVPSMVDHAEWIVPIALLLLFGAYLVRVDRYRKA